MGGPSGIGKRGGSYGRGGRGRGRFGRGRGGFGKGGRSSSTRKPDPEMVQLNLDCEMMLYNAEREGKDIEEVKAEIDRMKNEKRKELQQAREKKKLEDMENDLKEYFKKGAESKDTAEDPVGDSAELKTAPDTEQKKVEEEQEEKQS
uniref:Chromatin target of PRMT1 protein C-terminal domain-containing protein n=1 Tax=Timspurckia oligopyrenoides TaxID=708627 RepID=A0A7S0ZLN4_9RHOD|mmetsp:Transcript_9929/g.17886  ORF Transcript_9929/g.17886 Transcript_9929/m.17886 type:complete len:147 (+) Transcript_9929:57-497(+)